jgi:hypothetical protein
MADIALVLLIVLLCLCALTVCKSCIVHAAHLVLFGGPQNRHSQKNAVKRAAAAASATATLPPPSQRALRTKQEMDCFLDGNNDGL